jgi:branched-chain amino acid transport system permease protein
MIEMVYHLQLNAALGDAVQFLGVTLDAARRNSWFGALFCWLTGLGAVRADAAPLRQQWAEIQTEIEKEIKRRETT